MCLPHMFLHLMATPAVTPQPELQCLARAGGRLLLLSQQYGEQELTGLPRKPEVGRKALSSFGLEVGWTDAGTCHQRRRT